ncbi:MAG: NgoPII family restriction endonuclease [Hormoscilla sp. GM102CHS1]|nr:NgoPII family restriction endonuclease [Hormoscilla sp. GM102CHS1]
MEKKQLKLLWLIYGNCYVAEKETYQRLKRTIANEITEIPRKAKNSGRSAVRAVLYMGAVVAMRHNRENISFLRTSRREREVQKASFHRVRKILVIYDAMVRQNRSWQNRSSQGALS